MATEIHAEHVGSMLRQPWLLEARAAYRARSSTEADLRAAECTELKRTAVVCQYACPIWLLETLNVLMQIFLSLWLIVIPAAAISRTKSCGRKSLRSTVISSSIHPYSSGVYRQRW